jgi:hypothetical protein
MVTTTAPASVQAASSEAFQIEEKVTNQGFKIESFQFWSINKAMGEIRCLNLTIGEHLFTFDVIDDLSESDEVLSLAFDYMAGDDICVMSVSGKTVTLNLVGMDSKKLFFLQSKFPIPLLPWQELELRHAEATIAKYKGLLGA